MGSTDYEFEQEVYRYKCLQCREIFCMPNCGVCPSCKEKPEQENSLCFECLEHAYGHPTGDLMAQALVKPGNFVAISHDQVMHCCIVDKEFHVWQRGLDGEEET